ncbi:hypothetical protein JKP88DRAFT_328497 [Tribonema minus]|uniref:Uncharacterized protein n=1 Tax=Tribonema minus TaxID=303371 RepID=A0A835YPC5_9STRA|nr:hypothetical protein JKP88DRAFT_328497 [Tribonema minus]
MQPHGCFAAAAATSQVATAAVPAPGAVSVAAAPSDAADSPSKRKRSLSGVRRAGDSSSMLASAAGQAQLKVQVFGTLPESTSLLGTRELHLMEACMQEILNFVPLVSPAVLQQAVMEYSAEQGGEAPGIESDRRQARAAVLWACIGNGATLQADASAVVYGERGQDFLKECFDTACEEALSAHLLLAMFWGQLGEFEKRRRYVHFAEVMTYELDEVPPNLSISLTFMKALVTCNAQVTNHPHSIEDLPAPRAPHAAPDNHNNNNTPSAARHSTVDATQHQVLRALSFGLTTICQKTDPVPRALILAPLDAALDAMRAAAPLDGGGWHSDMALVVLQGMRALLLRGGAGAGARAAEAAAEADAAMHAVAAAVRVRPTLCTFPLCYHMCHLAAHALHRLRCADEYGALQRGLAPLQGKLALSLAYCTLPPLEDPESQDWPPICSKPDCSSLVWHRGASTLVMLSSGCAHATPCAGTPAPAAVVIDVGASAALGHAQARLE